MSCLLASSHTAFLHRPPLQQQLKPHLHPSQHRLHLWQKPNAHSRCWETRWQTLAVVICRRFHRATGARLGAARARNLRRRASGRSEAVSDLFAWLRLGGATGLSGLEVRKSTLGDGFAGLGVFALRNFEEGERVLSVPGGLCLQGEIDKEDAELLGPVGATAAALLRERHAARGSDFATYLDSLPRQEDLAGHPFLWPRGSGAASVASRRALAASPRATRRLRHARLRASVLVQRLLEGCYAKSEEEARWALAVVRSRAFPVSRGNAAVALCPLLDLLNHHSPSAGSSPVSGGAACRFARFHDRGSGSNGGQVDEENLELGMVAERSITMGEELCHLYDVCPAADFLANYGFVPEGSAGFEACLLEVPRSALSLGGDEALEARVTALQHRGLWRGARIGRPLLLPLGMAGTVSLLLPVARLAALPNKELNDERVSDLLDDLVPSQDVALEEAARSLAREWLAMRSAQLLAAAEDLVASTKKSDGLGCGGVRTSQNLCSRSIARLLELEHGLLERIAKGISA